MWLSPFTSLLRLYLNRIRVDTASEQLRVVLKTTALESQILRSDADMTSLDRLALSLQDFEDWAVSVREFEFLDHCVLRVVRKPIHYYDTLANLIAATELDINPKYCQVDLLLITMVEQWPFLVKSIDVPTVTHVSRWLVRYIEVTNSGNGYVEHLSPQGETARLLSQIRDQLKAEVQDISGRAVFEKILKERPEFGIEEPVAADTDIEVSHISRRVASPLKTLPNLAESSLPPGPPEEHEDHPGLHRWTRYEVQDSISEGHIKGLILCLCSKYMEIRKQALTGLRAFMMKLEVGCLPTLATDANISLGIGI